jgi:hypothetical protein
VTVGAIDLWAARRRLTDVLLPLLALAGRRARTPTFQVLAAVAGMLVGAAVIGRVVFGVTLMLGCLLVGVDGLLREVPERSGTPAGLVEPLERFRRAR